MAPVRAHGQTTLAMCRLAHAGGAALLIGLGCFAEEAHGARSQTTTAMEGLDNAIRGVAQSAADGVEGGMGPILARLQALEEEVREARDEHRNVGQQILSTHEEQQKTLSEFATRIASTVDVGSTQKKKKTGDRLEVKSARLARDPEATIKALWKAAPTLVDAPDTVSSILTRLARDETLRVEEDLTDPPIGPFAKKVIQDAVKEANGIPGMAEVIKETFDKKLEGKWQGLIGFEPFYSFAGSSRGKTMFRAYLGALEVVIYRSA
mmetsp:Transcript_84317/g.243751  ORF Transcript_84317/g.243751 Transcript_84317/m.243751 type:complete len:265 (-) Transcript_84317:216-1010(-)